MMGGIDMRPINFDKRPTMRRMTLLLLLATLLFAASPLAAQDKGGSFSVEALVVDSLTSAPLPYATVLVYRRPAAKEPVRSLLTDEDGRFETDLPARGSYRLTVSMLGKENVTRDFTANGRVNLGTLRMADDVEMIDEVAVTAKKPLVKVEMGKIAYSVEDDPQSATSTASEMLPTSRYMSTASPTP